MATATRPIPAHGTSPRYKGNANRPGCRCQPCTREAVRLGALRELDRLQGRPRRVPAGPTWQHVLLLRAAGLNDSQIARAAGMHQTSIARINTNPTVTRITENRVLAIPLTHRADSGHIPATGAVRRLQALYVMNHSLSQMASTLGMSVEYVARLARGEYSIVLVTTDQTLRRMYAQLSGIRGASLRTGHYAKRQGWHGPMAWNDIDDPNAQPEDDDPEQGLSRLEARQLLAATRAEEIAHLASFGVPAHEIAARVGLTVSYVRGQLDGDRAPGWRDQAVSA